MYHPGAGKERNLGTKTDGTFQIAGSSQRGHATDAGGGIAMLKPNVIYFPYINVPDNQWFTRTLLYWDHVYSIVPRDFMEGEGRLSQHMLGLVDVDAVKPLFPDDAHEKLDFRDFSNTFLRLVEDDSFPVQRGIITSNPPVFWVHAGKLNEIADPLCQMGLARTGRYPWYEVESYTARAFMLYLAGSFGELPDVDSDPVTDDEGSLKPGVGTEVADGSWRPELDELRYGILSDVLPAPSDAIDPATLVRFKEEHGLHLRQFRARVEQKLRSAMAIPDPVARSEFREAAAAEMKADVDEAARRLKESGWRTLTLGKLIGCAGVVGGLAGAVPSGGLSLVLSVLGSAKFVHDSLQTNAPTGYAAYSVAVSRELM